MLDYPPHKIDFKEFIMELHEESEEIQVDYELFALQNYPYHLEEWEMKQTEDEVRKIC